MTYANPTSINASAGATGITNYINEVTNHWVSNMLLIAIWVIVLMGFYKAKGDFVGALAVAGFSVFVVALLFWLGGFVSGWALAIAIAIMLVGVVVLLVDNR